MVELPSPSADAGVTHTDALPAGTRLGEFELLRLLAVGGFGMVYQAFDHSLQRQVAIKEYMPAALVGRGATASLTVRSSTQTQVYYAGLKSFVAEARLLAQFDHPSLVKVFRFWEENNTAYMVMPLYSGMTLAQACQWMRQPPTEAWLRKWLWSVLGALKLLHEAGMVHRDVSPDNIFLQDIGPPVLLDLGAARRAITDQTQQMTAILKVNYAPIEQYADAADMQQGPWTDLYSVAAVVHAVLSKEAPLPATFRVLNDRMRPFAEVVRQIEADTGQHYSPAFTEAITQALAIRPEERVRSVDAFIQGMQLTAPVSSMARFDWRAGCALLPAQRVVAAAGLSSPQALERTVQMGLMGPATAPAPGMAELPLPPTDAQASLLVAPTIYVPRTEARKVVADVPASVAAAPASPAPAAVSAAVSAAVPVAASAPRPRPARDPAPKRKSAATKAPLPAAAGHPQGRAPVLTRWALLACAALVLGGLAWWWAAEGRRPADAALAAAAPPAPAASAPAEAPVAAAEPAPAPLASAAEPPAVPAAPAAAASAPVPAAAALPPPTPRAVAPTAAARKPREREREPEPRPAPVRLVEERAPEPPPPAAPAPVVPLVAPVPAGLCADVAAFNRPACIQRECQKPANSQHTACVALRVQQHELYR